MKGHDDDDPAAHAYCPPTCGQEDDATASGRPYAEPEHVAHVARRHGLTLPEVALVRKRLRGCTAAEWDATPPAVRAAVEAVERLNRERDAHENDPEHKPSDACSFCRADGWLIVGGVR